MNKKQIVAIALIVILAFSFGAIIFPRTIIVQHTNTVTVENTKVVQVNSTNTVYINHTNTVYIPQVHYVYINNTQYVFINSTNTADIQYAESVIIAQAQNLTIDGVQISQLEQEMETLVFLLNQTKNNSTTETSAFSVIPWVNSTAKGYNVTCEAYVTVYNVTAIADVWYNGETYVCVFKLGTMQPNDSIILVTEPSEYSGYPPFCSVDGVTLSVYGEV